MANTHDLYPGTEYSMDPYPSQLMTTEYTTPVSEISVATDPRTAAQLKAVSDKLSTGAKAVEVQFLMPEVAESIPKQHLEEINRLRKLVGAELTLHGTLVEPTGVSRQGWDESQRVQAERQMWLSIERGHELDPKGNLVITFHSSNGLPDPETKVFDEKTGKEELKEFWVVDETTGRFNNLVPKINRLKEETGKEVSPEETIAKQEKESWFNALQSVNFHAHQGNDIIGRAFAPEKVGKKPLSPGVVEAAQGEARRNFYKMFIEGKGPQIIETLGSKAGGELNEVMSQVAHGDIYVRDAYAQFQNLFTLAYDAAEKKNDQTALGKLNAFRKSVAPKLKVLEEDPSRSDELAGEVIRGINLLRAIPTPKPTRALRDFAVDKSSDTFSNLALKSYKEFGDSSPIISIENPPAGMGMVRADQIKDMIEASRKKFEEKAVKAGISRGEAKKQAEKLIGATWDIGHANMIKKYGYGRTQMIEEARTIAPFVKHVHLSDNFGFEHTELPMGMGTAPFEEQLKIFSEKNKNLKKTIEAGNWYQYFKKTPLAETLSALGSPVYSMKMAPAWTEQQLASIGGAYFAGYGFNPEIHHSIYGSGFSSLPVELGGQMSGRSRLSGAPIE